MSTLPAKIEFTTEQYEIIKNQICRDATKDELALFLNQCYRTGLDPLSKQIYFIKYGKNITIVTAIDGYRAIADRSGKYAGSDDAIFEADEGASNPSKATVTVYKMVSGMRCPFTASARWFEYYPKANTFQWDKMPATMLAKCAEALALRKAFPNDLSGIYTKEEMDQADTHEIKSVKVQSDNSAAVRFYDGPITTIDDKIAKVKQMAVESKAAKQMQADEVYDPKISRLHKQFFFQECTAKGITDNDLIGKISKQCEGLYLADIPAAITEWIEENKKQKVVFKDTSDGIFDSEELPF